MADAGLRVWVLSDGQAGHYNQSRGIVRALETLQPVETDWIDMRLRAGLVRTLLRRRLNRMRRPDNLRFLKACCRIDELPGPRCDVLVSAGGKTSFANAWLAAYLDVPNIYAGSLRGLDPALFSAVLTLEAVAGADNNLVLPLPPSPIDATSVATAGATLRARLGSPQQRYWTLLVGGAGAGYRYDRLDWLALRELLKSLSERHGIRWLIASSRRTGRIAEQMLRDGMGSCSAMQSWYAGGDSFQIEEYLGAADQVFVTEDSMTMLTEAICSQRPVHSLAPRSAQPAACFDQALQRFSNQGWLCRHRIEELAMQPESLGQQKCRVLRGSPTADLAERLRRFLQ